MKSLLKLNKYFFKYKKALISGFVFIFISDIAQVTIPIFLKNSINALKQTPDYTLLLQYAGLILGAAIISGVFRFLIRETIIVTSRKIEYDLRNDFWAHLLKLPLRFFQTNSTGNIMAHTTNDINAVRMYIGPVVMYSVDTIVKFILIISIMISLAPLLTLYALLPLPFLSFSVYKLSKKIHKKFTKIQEKFSELTTKAQENFAGIRVIKAYVREQSEIEQFKKLSSDYLEKNMDKIRIQAFFMPMLFMITGISIIVVIWIGGSMIIEDKITLGEIMAFVAYLGMLIWPIIAFGWIINIAQQASASMKRLLSIWSEKEEITNSKITDYSISDITGKIEFRNVSFGYGKNLPLVLKNINLNIPSGTTLAIVGNTGSGKTTLVNLIPRLYDVTEGEILIDGNDIRKIPVEVLRSKIGMAPQETFLFSDTLKNNILYGLNGNGKADEILDEVTEIAQLKKDVETFPGKFETVLGERGITLSGGQKQRTALARALAIHPKILILDDSFSAVDTNTEEEILKRLKNFMKGRTNIIISHRISTVKDADKIIVLENGMIKEEGTHSELIRLGGIYADLHYKQLLEEELKEMN